MTVTAERLRQLFRYEKSTGNFVRRVLVANQHPGTIAGGVAANGYVYIGIDDVHYTAHRLAVLYVTGSWPERQVDHKNTIRSDNRWRNLRPSTSAQNAHNSKLRSNNASGFKGIYLHKASGLWHATIMADGVKTSLGYFKTPQKAHAAYAEGARIHHGKFARTA